MSTAQAPTATIELQAGQARAVIDPAAGGRLTSLVVAGNELLTGVTDSIVPPSMRHGSFPMAPWAGRLRNGEFHLDERSFSFPANAGPHAIHGLAHDLTWSTTGTNRIGVDLAGVWDLGGQLTQAFELTDSELAITLTAMAISDRLPVTLGFHPWFRRRLGVGGDASLSFDASWQYQRDGDGLPDGTLIGPLASPWDDCFIVPAKQVAIAWPGALVLRVKSDHDHFVVFNERDDSIGVEPQTGPPNAFNLPGAQILEPGEETSITMRLQWATL